MPRVPGGNNGLGTASAVVGGVSLVLGVLAFVPFLLGGFAGLWLSVRGRRRVVDGDASNPRAVLFGFVTSVAACGLFVVLLVVSVLGSSGVLGS